MATVIGIDTGDKCGWAVLGEEGHIDSGVWDFREPKRWLGAGMCCLKFRNVLTKLIYENQPDAIYFEEVRGHKGPDAARKYGGYVFGLMSQCEKLKIPYRSVPVAAVKAAATGKGVAKKDAMIVAARERWPDVLIQDDNQADALFVGVCGLEHLQGATT